jgi:hypothetical protein
VTLALLTCLALIALLAYREWGSARDRRADRLFREALERELIEQRQVAAQERRELYQRIQAPEVAVAEAHRERRGPYVKRKPIGADDDAAFNGRGEKVKTDG